LIISVCHPVFTAKAPCFEIYETSARDLSYS
jgi:hypothetical protein